MKKLLHRFKHPLQGLREAFLNDKSFRGQCYLFLFICFGILAFITELSAWGILFLIQAGVLILITELQNSALEAALNKLHPELHDDIKKSKDLAAAAVLVSGVFLLIVVAVLVADWLLIWS